MIKIRFETEIEVNRFCSHLELKEKAKYKKRERERKRERRKLTLEFSLNFHSDLYARPRGQ